jgi:AcrR family transcriptional regulator
MAIASTHSKTRQHILRAALKSFARCGYAATSVRQIVDDARVSKPALYYYFADKAQLFQALVDQAHDERYRLMQAAAQRGRTVATKLEQIITAIFEFSLENRELMRLAFATAFAAPGESPGRVRCAEKGRRNYDFVRSLIEQGQVAGELDRRFTVDDLAMGIYGQLNSYVMVRLLVPDCPLDQRTARQIVRLFLQGAARRPAGANAAPPGPMPHRAPFRQNVSPFPDHDTQDITGCIHSPGGRRRPCRRQSPAVQEAH